MYTFQRLAHHQILLQGGYRWLDMTTYVVPEVNSSAYNQDDFFRDLVASPAYHDTYLAPDSWLHDSKDAHGPFSIKRITPGTFVPLERADFEKRIFEVVSRFENTTDEMITEVTSLIRSVPESAYYYTLNLRHDMHDTKCADEPMDFEWSFIHSEWSEFVAIDPESRRLFIIVIGLD